MLSRTCHKTGKVAATAKIAPGTDQMAFDLKRKRLYCASRGFVSVVQVTAEGGVRSLGDVPSPRGAHTLALGPVTGDVWVSYSDAAGSISSGSPRRGSARAVTDGGPPGAWSARRFSCSSAAP